MNFFCSEDEMTIKASDEKSKFDDALLSEWNKAVKNGHFRYTLDTMTSRVVDGHYNFVITHNKKRFEQRRRPDTVDSINKVFDPNKFNFTKVPPHEIILRLRDSDDDGNKEDSCPILINVAPLGVGHVLAVPSPHRHFNQMLRDEAIIIALRMILLSNSQYFYTGYNSLCAYASVNHLHVHGWYFEDQLYASVANLKPLSKQLHLYEFERYPAPGFVLILDDLAKFNLTCRLISILAGYLQTSDIAYNMFVCRGQPPTAAGHDTVVRICVWPRKHYINNAESHNRFNVAVAELAGFLICRDEEDLDLDEETICSEIGGVRLSDDDYKRISRDVIQLFDEVNGSG